MLQCIKKVRHMATPCIHIARSCAYSCPSYAHDKLALQHGCCIAPGIPQAHGINSTLLGILLPSIVVLVAVVLVLVAVLYRVGMLKAVAQYKDAQLKKRPPEVGQPVTLVLTDVQGSTELW